MSWIVEPRSLEYDDPLESPSFLGWIPRGENRPPFRVSFLLKEVEAANLMPPRWTEFHTDLAIKPCFITSYHRHLKQIFDIPLEEIIRSPRCAPAFLIGILFHVSNIFF